MAFSYKKITAAALAAVCVASMTGCADTGYIGTVDGMEIRNGIYLWCVQSAYSDCYAEITEVKEEAGDTSEVNDVFVQTVDGKPANDWIKENAVVELRRYVAINRLFDENGLTFTAEDQAVINADVNKIWDEEDWYAQYIYGTKTMGEYYESIGMGMDTIRDVYTTNKKEEKLLEALYTEGGSKAVPAEELDSYITENYANVKYIELPFKDMYGLALPNDDEIAAVVAKAQDYVDRLNNGESFIEIQYEVDLKNAQDEAQVDQEAYFETATYENPSDEEWDKAVEEARANATAEKAESVEELEVVINKDSSSLDEELTEFVWNLDADGKAYLLETEEAAYVVVRDDITTKESWKAESLTVVLDALVGEEFDAYLIEVGSAYDVELNDRLVNDKYSPDTYKAFKSDFE